MSVGSPAAGKRKPEGSGMLTPECSYHSATTQGERARQSVCLRESVCSIVAVRADAAHHASLSQSGPLASCVSGSHGKTQRLKFTHVCAPGTVGSIQGKWWRAWESLIGRFLDCLDLGFSPTIYWDLYHFQDHFVCSMFCLLFIYNYLTEIQHTIQPPNQHF